MITRWYRRRRRLVLTTLALVVVAPLAAAALSGGGDLFVVANAPKRGESLVVLLAADPGPRGGCSGVATVELALPAFGPDQREEIVFPGILGKVPIQRCQGSVEIPYARFAKVNGQYLVRAAFDGRTAETLVTVEKFVEWVYVRAFTDEEHGRARIDVAFDRLLAQPLTSSVFASGTLQLEVRWEGCSPPSVAGLPIPITDPTYECQARGDLVFDAEIPIEDQASASIFIPYSNLESSKFREDRPDEGWYNVTATFHNDQAKGNYNVPMDPTVFQEDPPGNWFEVSYE